MEGYLEKRGRGQVFSLYKPWYSRLFVLNAESGELSYFTTLNGYLLICDVCVPKNILAKDP
jgi:hypothetical protein